MVTLGSPVRSVVGEKTAKELSSRLGIHTVEDLLRHYPRRYYERGELTDLSSLRPGEQVTVQATVASVSGKWVEAKPGSGRRKPLHKLEVVVTDGRAKLRLTFFNSQWLQSRLPPGTEALFAGKVDAFRGRLQLTNPEVNVGEDSDSFAGVLKPIYPATAKLASWSVGKAVSTVLDMTGDVHDPLPEAIRERLQLLPLADALRLVHRPESWADVSAAHQRLRFDEAFLLQVMLARRRAESSALPTTARVPRDGGLLDAFDDRLPFTLTAGQQAVAGEVAADLAKDHPMQRLLQGEVGSGKTVVALRAMLAVVDTGGQAVLLAPTEVLAQQHHRSVTELLGPLAERGLLGGSDLGTRVALLTGSQGTAARRQALLDVACGDAGIVIGTHALIQDAVDFFDLGLVVVDEQHRFGVEQRDALRGKAAAPPHFLVMTATPIPRTVAITVFGDLDVSTLTELPAGRAPITTHLVPVGEKPHFLERAWSRLREEVEKGHQAYVVCPRIGLDAAEEEPVIERGGLWLVPDLVEEPALRPAVAVLDIAPMLAEGPLAGLRVEMLHGRLPPDTKDDVMRRFGAGELDVLVATTVVEVGVDVANASTMVVLDAERFGVSQLHQLRGRVGRGSAPGLCLLVTDTAPGSPSRKRLEAVAATVDGFELSRIDLETRREGDVLGASQSGRRSSLRLLSVLRDEEVIVTAREEATRLVAKDPHLFANAALRQAVDALLADERSDYLEKL